MLKRFPSAAWSGVHAAHLLNRAGFGGSPAEISALEELGLGNAVEKILRGDEDDDLFSPPSLSMPTEILAHQSAVRSVSDEEGKRKMQQQSRRDQGEQIRALRQWWLTRMRHTTHPLREKMTLFWHGHFATSFEKVNLAFLMWQQNETLRAGALGDFRELTKQVSKDPAMMRYLDTVRSGRGRPNENFSRELMELFTLGEGVCYTEDDIRESARAFTGYRVNPQTLGFVFARRQFDPEDKVFLGQKGPFDGDGIIDIITTQEECAEFIVRKLWLFFVSDTPDPAVIQALAAQFRRSDFCIREVLRELFLSAVFYDPRVVRSQVKSPVQWIVQTARSLEAPLPSASALEAALSQMGQVLFAPPNVKGWDAGRAWISSSTLLFRYNLAGYIVSGKPPQLEGIRKEAGVVELDLETLAPPELRRDPARLCDTLVFRLLNAPLPERERERLLVFLRGEGAEVSDATLRDFLHLVMSTPEYQLT